MDEPRNRRISVNFAIGIAGAIALCVTTFFTIGHVDPKAPNLLRIVGGTLIIALAMAWACWFSIRAHFAQDEYQRQREITVTFWGASLGLAASAPIFFFVAVGGVHWLNPAESSHGAVFRAFVIGYLLPALCVLIGVIVARVGQRLGGRLDGGRAAAS